MKKTRFIWGILLLAIVSCIKEESKYENLLPIDSGVNIRLIETFNTSPRTLHLYCSTEKIYGCYNFPIIAESRQSSNAIDISFQGIIQSDFCQTALGPATTTVDLGALNVGTYTLRLSVGKVTHTGKLIVSDDSYKVDFDDNSAFAFSNPRLNRIPEQTIWGLIGYHEAETTSRVDSFLNTLVALGAKKRSYAPGDYYEFWIDEDGDITDYPGALWGYRFDRPFVFHYSGDPAAIESLIKQYKDDMSIRVHTDKGGRFLSWMY